MTRQRDADDRLLSAARRAQARGRARSDVFGQVGHLFRDPAWSILLEAFVSERTGRLSQVKSLTTASGVPQTTALRWIAQLEAAGLLMRRRHGHDRRSSLVVLTEAARATMIGLLGRLD